MILCRTCGNWFGDQVLLADHRCEPAPRRVCVGIDPGNKLSGVAVWGANGGKFLVASSISPREVTEAEAVELLNRMLGPDVNWCAAIERPPPIKAGARFAPTFAVTFWTRVIEQLALARYKRWGLRPRGVTILHPLSASWRKPIGISTRGTGETQEERSSQLKREAIAWCRMLGIEVDRADVAEAVGIAAWLARASMFPIMKKKKLAPVRWAP